MKPIGIDTATQHFSRPMRRVAAGEELLIKRAGRPVARLVPVELRTLRALGVDEGAFTVPDDFNHPTTKDRSDVLDP